MLTTSMTMSQALDLVAQARKDQEALVYEGQRLTYGQILGRVRALACGLKSLGIGKGERVVCLLHPGPEFVFLFFAVAEIGAVLLPVNPLIRPRGLIDIMQDAEPSGLVSARPLDHEEVYKGLAGLRHFVRVGSGAGRGIALDDLIRTGVGAPRPVAQVSPQDLLVLLYTSGTTGKPKGTMHSHRSLIAPVLASIKFRDLWVKRPSLKWLGQSAMALVRYRGRLLSAAGKPQSILSTGGWHNITGLEVMLQALLMGDRLVVLPRFHPREALRLVEREQVTILVAVPMAFRMMLELEDFESHNTRSLLICATGGAPCPPELASEIQRRFGCALHIGFGTTETGGGISATDLSDSRHRQAYTVGRPMPGIEVKVVDEERQPLPAGQVGELACRGEGLMLGYYHAPELSSGVIDEDGWYYTGDLAMIDEQGYLQIVGRVKDVIIRGGQNLYPAEIEAFLVAHPNIREAAVVGVPSRVAGEEAWAFLILEDGVQMSALDVLNYCRSELEPYKIPTQVRFLQDFPRAESGKPQKFRLRQAAFKENEEAETHAE